MYIILYSTFTIAYTNIVVKVLNWAHRVIIGQSFFSQSKLFHEGARLAIKFGDPNLQLWGFKKAEYKYSQPRPVTHYAFLRITAFRQMLFWKLLYSQHQLISSDNFITTVFIYLTKPKYNLLSHNWSNHGRTRWLVKTEASVLFLQIALWSYLAVEISVLVF